MPVQKNIKTCYKELCLYIIQSAIIDLNRENVTDYTKQAEEFFQSKFYSQMKAFLEVENNEFDFENNSRVLKIGDKIGKYTITKLYKQYTNLYAELRCRCGKIYNKRVKNLENLKIDFCYCGKKTSYKTKLKINVNEFKKDYLTGEKLDIICNKYSISIPTLYKLLRKYDIQKRSFKRAL